MEQKQQVKAKRQRKHWVLKWPIPFSLIFPIVMLIATTLVAVLTATVIHHYFGDKLPQTGNFTEDYVYSPTRIIFSFLIVWIMHRFVMKEWTFGFRKIESWKEIFIFGWSLIFFGLQNITDGLFFLGKEFVGLNGILLAVITGFAPGLFEEVMCRGVVLNNYLYQWKDRPNVIIKGTLFSSVVFGVLHLWNIGNAPVADTLSQVVYAAGVGVILSAIYLRTGNLWPGILLHAFVDILDSLFIGGIEGNLFTRVEEILTALICFGIGLYLIRPAKQQEIKEKIGWIFDQKETEVSQQEQG